MIKAKNKLIHLLAYYFNNYLAFFSFINYYFLLKINELNKIHPCHCLFQVQFI